MPGTDELGVDSLGRVLGQESSSAPVPGDTLVTSIDARRPGASSSASCARRSWPPGRPSTRSPAAPTRRPRAPPSCSTRTTAGWSRWPASRPTSRRCGSAASAAGSCRAVLQGLRRAAAVAADPGAAGARLDVQAVHGARRAVQRLHDGHAAELLVVVHGRQPRVQELRVRRLRLHRLSTRRCSSPATRSSTGSATPCGSRRAARTPRPARRTRWSRPRRAPASVAHRHRPAGRGQRPDRRPALEDAVLEGQQGLLLPDRRGAGQRLPARVRPRVLHRRLRVPGRRRGQLRHRPGRHDHHADAAGGRLRGDRQRWHAVRARGWARRSSAPTASVVRRIKPHVQGRLPFPQR